MPKLDKGHIAIILIVFTLIVATYKGTNTQPSNSCLELAQELTILEAQLVTAEEFEDLPTVANILNQQLKLVFNSQPSKQCMDYIQNN